MITTVGLTVDPGNADRLYQPPYVLNFNPFRTLVSSQFFVYIHRKCLGLLLTYAYFVKIS